MTQETETDNTSVFVKRSTRAALGWMTTGMITINVILMWYMLQKIINLETRVSVIEDSRLTNKEAEQIRSDIESVRHGYREAVAIIGGKIDGVNIKMAVLESKLEDIKDEIRKSK